MAQTFFYCISLTSVTLGSGVTSIENEAFGGCTSLTTINVLSGNNAYTSENGILYSKDKKTLVAYPAGKTGTFTIPSGVTNIGFEAFSFNSLTSLTIPSSITSIGSKAFHRCFNLASITIPNSITEIVDYTFSSCISLTNVTIPNSITKIGSGAFYDCTSLTSITIPNSVIEIGSDAFDYCPNLTSVGFKGAIPSSGMSSDAFPGDLRTKFYTTDSTNGTPGTYTRVNYGMTWTKTN
jgi:hypothetical protein